MDLQAEKYSLIEHIMNIKEVSMITKFKDFLKSQEEDFWYDLSAQEKAEIKQGIAELEKGEGTDYNEFMDAHR